MAQPAVELTFEPSELTGLQTTGRILGTPQQALTAALHQTRTQMMTEMKERFDRPGLVTAATVANVADASWDLVKPGWMRISVPVLAEAYLRAYRKADAGDISREAVYALARRHAANLGDYYQDTSKSAMLEGFSGYVNRKVATRAAANQVAEAYGLTPRQMRGYIAARLQWERSIKSFTPMGLKKEAAKYIVRSLYQRYKSIADQEIHNAGEQGKQLAWMYLLEKGDLPAHAEKMWLTAKDERVCPVCGPLHGTRIPITEKFETSEGDFWSPGLHPNCRCELRLLPHEFKDVNDVQKDLAGGQLVDFNRKHPRGAHGQFSAVRRAMVTTADPDDEFWSIVEGGRPGGATKVKTAPVTAVDRTTDTELKRQFEEVVRATVMPNTGRARPAAPQARAKPQVQAEVKVAAPARPQVQTVRPQVVSTKAIAQVAKPEVVAVQLRRAMAAPAKPKTKPKVEAGPKAPPQNLDKPLYAVVPRTYFDDDGMKTIDMTTGMSLVASRQEAEAIADGNVNSTKRNWVRLITRRKAKEGFEIGGVELPAPWEMKPHVGKRRLVEGHGFLYWDMTEDQVSELVDYVAQQAVAENLNVDYRHTKGKAAPIIKPDVPTFTGFWRDENGKKVGSADSFTADEMAKEFRLKPQNFDTRILEVNQAIQGQADLDDWDEHHNPTGAAVSGKYRVVPGSVTATEESGRATHMRIEPIREPGETD